MFMCSAVPSVFEQIGPGIVRRGGVLACVLYGMQDIHLVAYV